jgi:hypothetical protein
VLKLNCAGGASRPNSLLVGCKMRNLIHDPSLSKEWTLREARVGNGSPNRPMLKEVTISG